jgi:hypothetical protein
MAREAQQRCRDEDRDHAEDFDVHPRRNQHIHRKRRGAEIQNAYRDLQQHRRSGRKPDRPPAGSDTPGLEPGPDQKRENPNKQRRCQQPIDLRRQMIDQADGIGLPKQAEPECRQVAQPEGEAGQKADIRHLENAEAMARIDSIADHRCDQRNGSDTMRDRITGKTRERCDPVGNVGTPNGPKCQQIVDRQTAV